MRLKYRSKKISKKVSREYFCRSCNFYEFWRRGNRTSIKIARKYFYEKGQTNKNRIITFKGAFHGRTLASLFAANNPEHIKGFEPKVDGFDQVDFGDHDSLKKAINKNTAAIMVDRF